MAPGVAVEGVPRVAANGRAAPLGQARVSADRLPGIKYYSAPKAKYKSLDEVDPELLAVYDKLGIPLSERKALLGIEDSAAETNGDGEVAQGPRRVAVDAVFDSVSVKTTFQNELKKAGVIFMSFGEAAREHPELVKKYLGSVVPYRDNFYATLNSAVFTDGSFVYIPPGVKCPMELSTYFRINAKSTGQFERTLIIADEGAQVSYLEGCTAPMRDENQLHAAVVELVAHKDAFIKYSTVQNWYPGDDEGRAGSTTSSPSAASASARTPRSPGRRWRRAARSPGSTRASSSRATTARESFTAWR